MARQDLIVSFLSSVPKAVLSSFARKPLQMVCPVSQFDTYETLADGSKRLLWPGGRPGYVKWLSQFAGPEGVIRGLARAAGADVGDEIGHVCVVGFSNGCIGVDETLRYADAQRIDTVLAVDGVHGAYGGDGKPLPAAYKNFLNQAAHVASKNAEDPFGPIFVVTHSSIVPPGFPSTTETAGLIWSLVTSRIHDYVTVGCGYDCAPARHVSSLLLENSGRYRICQQGLCYEWAGLADGWYDQRAANGSFVLGWGDRTAGRVHTKDPRGLTDHGFQAEAVLPALLREFCVKRWKTDCPPSAVVGFGQDGASCKMAEGVIYEHASPDKKDYFPELSSSPPAPAPCPQPPAGEVLVGSPTDPCLTMPARPGSASASADSREWGWLWALGAFGAGYFLSRRLSR